ncbi:MAG: hypothetical protein LOD94_03005 [Gammaproteobacteria bacterium]|nr:hypothetical protein [Gammaproteobacteria bacterium]
MRCRNVQRALISVGACALVTAAVEAQPPHASAKRFDDVYWENVFDALERGREIFRFDNFGNEDFWGGTLRLHEAIAGRDHGGVGAGVSPEAALGLGLKVDIDALPPQLVQALRRGRVDLGDPAVTLSLLSLDAVVGVRGLFDDAGRLESVGITCALCHSTVDDAFAPGIGRRLDGWPNRDLDVGAIIAAAPDLSFFASLLGVSEDTVRDVLLDWGPGKFDAHLILDGRPTTPDGKTAAVLLPPAFGLAGVNLHTSNGWGSVTHWNAFVAVLEMQGKGTFYDPRLEDAGKFPIAAANGFGNVRPEEDLVTSKLGPLHLYQLSLQAPRPPRDLYDAEAAKRGEALFVGRADCARCHVPPLFTEPGWNLHTPEEIGIDGNHAQRGPEDRYRTTPLRGLWTHVEGGFYHDGRFATLAEVIEHYDRHFGLGLSERDKRDLAEYLMSL